MADDNYDAFGDIVHRETGIFGLDTPGMHNALHTHENAKTVPAPEGVHVNLQCSVCGASRDMVIEWPEITCLALNVSPHNFIAEMNPWKFTSQGWCPVGVHCSCADRPEVWVFITQQEAAGHVRHGQSNGWPYFRSRQGQPSFYQTLVAHVQRATTQQAR